MIVFQIPATAAAAGILISQVPVIRRVVWRYNAAVVMRIRAVVDTNVVFEGLTYRDGPAGIIVSAWMAELFESCVSQALAYEYEDVLARKLAPERWARIRVVLDALLDRAELVTAYYSWRPSSPDPGDEHVIDCAMNARAIVVTSNLRDFELARVELQLPVLSPVDFLTLLQAEARGS